MNDKEKLDLLEHYIIDLINSRMDLQLTRGKFAIGLHKFNKVECAYLDGELDALDKVRNFIRNRLRKGETE